MKGNLTIKLVAALAILLGVYAIVKFTLGKSRSNSYHESLVNIDTAAITKIEIENAGALTILTKKNEGWSVGSNKVATTTSVKGLLDKLMTIEPSRLASRKEESWKDFQVDSTGTRVKIYQGSNKTLDLMIGRFGVEGQRSFYSYVRLSDEPDTYVANNFMGMGIGKTDADYRNNQILKVKKDSIQSIEFAYQDGSFILEKLENSSWTIGGVSADSVRVAEYINGLANVTSKKFYDEKLENSTKEVIINIEGYDKITLSSNGSKLIKSSQNEGEVFEDSDAYLKIFKLPEDFMGE